MAKEYVAKPGQGVLFKNDKKTKDTQPDMTGNILTLDGQKLRLSAWKKEGKKGVFLSVSMQEYSDEKPQNKREPEGLGF
jgi:hypothetical protein